MAAEEKVLSHRGIVRALMASLEPLEYVRSFWEGGAISYDREDRFSDIDAYLYVDRGAVEKTFEVVERTLRSLSPISLKYVPKGIPRGTSQAFYKLERADEYLLVDLAVLTEESEELYLVPEIHGRAVFYFNKEGGVKVPHLDEGAFRKKMEESFERCRVRYSMFNNFVTKEVARGNTLEAIDNYYALTISILVTLLRMRAHPHHYDFKMRYVHYELPSDVVERVERLCLVKDVIDLESKHAEASRWVEELLAEGVPGGPGSG